MNVRAAPLIGLIALCNYYGALSSCPSEVPQYAACTGKAADYCQTDLNDSQVNYLCTSYCCLTTGHCGTQGSGNVCASCTVGDPVINGFLGTSFRMVGQAGMWSNLISEATHNVNFHMVSANLSSKANGGTVIDAMAVMYNNNTLEASVDAEGELSVIIDGVHITKDDLEAAPNKAREGELDEDTTVVVQLYREVFGHSMHVITPLLDMTFFVTARAMDGYYKEYLPAYLNFYIGLKDASVSGIHGMLGQTAPQSTAKKPRKFATASPPNSIELFSGEGTEADYLVSGPFATDFAFSQFGMEPEVLPTFQVARRSLIEGVQKTGFATFQPHA